MESDKISPEIHIQMYKIKYANLIIAIANGNISYLLVLMNLLNGKERKIV
jgi:hypothetical protein